ncbi:TonB-dependent receptor [Brevundimonas pondensis]|uniref:TonB-dependent receptor n=1 Tax=Brevundimonas pondensis TaxID=2774189 RepID=UPI0028D4CC78|nr:TonB-dependent receptor [uncultured Brevundimonas sp.]
MKIKNIRQRLLQSTMIGGTALMALTVVSVGTLAAPTVASAQDYTSGILSGSVTDAGGSPVAGASVRVTSAQGSVRTVSTDASGAFRITALPVGAYDITIEQSGFNSLTQRLMVQAGSSTYAFTLQQPGGATEGASTVADVIVTAKKVQDFNATDTGLAVNVQELSNRVPVGRSINAITQLSPGASAPDASINASARRGQSLTGFSGTSAAESSYYINGMNVTDARTLLGYAELPFDAIQSIDVKTGGYQAEYGRGTGGVVSIVTRSGSNEFHGGVSAFYSPDSLRSKRGLAYSPAANGSTGGQVFNGFAAAESKDLSIWASGPIWRDHIFFFGNYNMRETDSRGGVAFSDFGVATGAQARTVSNDPRWFTKFDFVLNENHRLEASIFSDEQTIDNLAYSYSRPAFTRTDSPTSWSRAGGLNQIYKYTGVFTDWFTLSGLYGKTESDYTDYGPSINIAGVRDYYTGRAPVAGGYNWVTDGRFGGPFNLAGEEVRETYRIDADFYVSLFGDHHLRVGYDRENLVSTAKTAYSGGALYYARGLATATCAGVTPGADGCIQRRIYASEGTYESEQSAFYIQDSWDLASNFSLQLGVRNDVYDYQNKAGQSYIKVSDQWAPRIGFNWDPFKNGVDRIYGSMGDYYLPIATNTSIRASSGETFEDRYFQAVRDAGGKLVLNADGTPQLGAQLGDPVYLSPPGVPDPRSVAEADLKPMYEREFVIGYERSFTSDGFLGDWSAGVRYVNRNLESAIEDVAIGDAVYRYCKRTNQLALCNPGGETPVDFSSFFPYVLVNPGDGATVYVDLQGDASDSPDYNPQTINLTAEDMKFPQVEREYQALEFTFNRPFDGRWSLAGSYTLGKSYGNYEGAVKSDIGQTDTSITQDFDHYTNTIGAEGYLPNHRRHVIKMYGSYQVNDVVSIGGNFTAQSGRKYGCIGYAPPGADELAPDAAGTPSAWFCPLGAGGAVIPTPRGSMGETPWTYNFDVNMAFTLMDSETRGSLVATVDIFNLFDNDEVTRVVEQGVARVAPTYPLSPTYGLARSYQTPRSLRFGLRYRF